MISKFKSLLFRKWPECVFLVAMVTLIIQLLPSFWTGMLWAIDMRNWSESTWLAMTLAGLFILLLIRFAPDLIAAFEQRRKRISGQRRAIQLANQINERREVLRRIQISRKRRIY